MNDESTDLKLAELLKQDEHPNFEFDISLSHVRTAVNDQNPAVTNVVLIVCFESSSDECLQTHIGIKKAQGECIGRSLHVKHLQLVLLSLSDAAGVIPFCEGLALNRSLRSLTLEFYSAADERCCHYDALFELLLPFFENNTNLNQVEFCYNDSPCLSPYLIQALCSSKSLKQVTVEKLGGDITTAEGQLIQALCRNRHLHRLCLKGNLLSEDGLSAAFYDPECSLKSIEVNGGMYENATQVRSIVSTGNLQHIAWGGRIPDSLFKLQSPNVTLKKLDLSISSRFSIEGMRRRHVHVDKNLAEALKGFCALRSLDLSRQSFQPGALKTMLRVLLRPESKLEELDLNYCTGFDEVSLRVLGDRLFLAQNSTLKSLGLRSSESITSCAWKVFFSKLKDNDCQLERIFLRDNLSINDGVVPELLRLLTNGTKIKSFDLCDCGVSRRGWNSLANAVSRTKVEKLLYDHHGLLYATELPSVFQQVIANENLKELELFSIPVNITGAVLESLNGPSCRLESLGFWCHINSQQQLEQAIREWVVALKNNITLKKWHIEFEFLENYYTEFIWDELSSILCDEGSDSIEAIYHSNHTLSRFDFNFHAPGDTGDSDSEDESRIYYSAEDKMPLELYSLLHLNRNPNKAAVARRKVMNGASSATRLVDLNLGLSVLPQLFYWIGKEKERQDLSLMFGFLLNMPALLEGANAAPSSPDRKRAKMTNYHRYLRTSRG
jgi:hypothetical protein